ncbi:MAG: DoxX family protein [Gammaproteobacteria bacterium]|nr:DoxX family protein [Gammaproteobacteria bacterium]MDE2252250.1 DoxX family protein [Gammaproteobacteria bacterium]
MKIIGQLFSLYAGFSRTMDWLRSPLLLATRFYVGWQFTKSGWLKYTSWDTTLGLFRDEYHVPLLPPGLAAVLGTCGELGFPILLYLGLFGRIGALGTLFVNVMAVVSYRQVLLSEGFEAALGQHVLWGFMLLVLLAFGPGKLSLDAWLERRAAGPARD